MAENVEQIEARLCAYLDGELDDAERAQIEAHLAANPSHAELLRQLMRQKQAIQRLPRERAPADLMDEFQGQLEREILLRVPETPASAGRIGWTRLVSAAAVIALASGLGIVVYTVLPKGEPPLVAADLSHERKLEGERMAAPQELARSGRTVTAAAVAADAAVADIAIASAAPPAPAAPQALAKGGEAGLVDGAAMVPAEPGGAPAPAIAAAPMALADANAEPQTLVITVLAGDVQRANDDLVEFLAARNLDYALAEGQARLDANPERRIAMYRLADERARREVGEALMQHDPLVANAPMPEAPEARTQTRGALAKDAGAEATMARAARFVQTPEPPAAAVAQEEPAPGQADRDALREPAGAGAGAANAVLARGGARGGREAESPVADETQARAFGALPSPSPVRTRAVQPMGRGKPADHGRVIIVRNVNGDQVAELKEVLFRPGQRLEERSRHLLFAPAAATGVEQAQGPQIGGVAGVYMDPTRALGTLENVLAQWSPPATRPAGQDAIADRPALGIQQAQNGAIVIGGPDRQQLYNCVIVLQNPLTPAAQPAQALEPATLPAPAGDAAKE